jgi:hypothetical protein
MVVGFQRHVPANFPSSMTRYPLYGRLGGPWVSPDACGKSHSQRHWTRRAVQLVEGCRSY